MRKRLVFLHQMAWSATPQHLPRKVTHHRSAVLAKLGWSEWGLQIGPRLALPLWILLTLSSPLSRAAIVQQFVQWFYPVCKIWHKFHIVSQQSQKWLKLTHILRRQRFDNHLHFWWSFVLYRKTEKLTLVPRNLSPKLCSLCKATSRVWSIALQWYTVGVFNSTVTSISPLTGPVSPW